MSKAELTLFKVEDPTPEEIAALFEQLTGQKSTPEDLAEVAKILAEMPRPRLAKANTATILISTVHDAGVRTVAIPFVTVSRG
jgi:hypothetical protein